jgi:hypothetical protein
MLTFLVAPSRWPVSNGLLARMRRNGSGGDGYEKREHCGLRWEAQLWSEGRRPMLDGGKRASWGCPRGYSGLVRSGRGTHKHGGGAQQVVDGDVRRVPAGAGRADGRVVCRV